MIRLSLSICLMVGVVLPGCARYHVVPRETGRIDGSRGIATSSDTSWTIESEPAAAQDEED